MDKMDNPARREGCHANKPYTTRDIKSGKIRPKTDGCTAERAAGIAS